MTGMALEVKIVMLDGQVYMPGDRAELLDGEMIPVASISISDCGEEDTDDE